jgi:hypothetical protein
VAAVEGLSCYGENSLTNDQGKRPNLGMAIACQTTGQTCSTMVRHAGA